MHIDTYHQQQNNPLLLSQTHLSTQQEVKIYTRSNRNKKTSNPPLFELNNNKPSTNKGPMVCEYKRGRRHKRKNDIEICFFLCLSGLEKLIFFFFVVVAIAVLLRVVFIFFFGNRISLSLSRPCLVPVCSYTPSVSLFILPTIPLILFFSFSFLFVPVGRLPISIGGRGIEQKR